jgi:hypothetical protein
MSNDMKVIMERWDRFVLFEKKLLKKSKTSEVRDKKQIQQISKVQKINSSYKTLVEYSYLKMKR